MTIIPVLNDSPEIDALYAAYLQKLKLSGFRGDISADYGSRLTVATDNSVYQVLPQAVLFPRDEADNQRIMRLAANSEFHGVQFAPRGGGTGTNGQALNTGIVIDVSRYQNKILEMNVAAGWVRVQPGVVLDQLQDLINPEGYFFAPELSPSNRATLGGMANTDACGKGSRLYGRTGDHVLGLRVVLNDGDIIDTQRMDAQDLQTKQAQTDREGELYRELAKVCTDVPAIANADKLGRFVTAYNLWHVYDDKKSFSLNPLLCGAEGTLALVSELTLKITPIPKQKALFSIRYQTFDAALAAAQELLKHQPSAIETVDDKILSLAKADIIFPKVRPYLGVSEDFTGNAVNLVEFVADARSTFEQKVEALKIELATATGVISFHYTEEKAPQAALWDLRKKGVGLLGNTAGKRRPIPFVEDTAVPPEHLAAYIREFRALLDSHGLSYGMFGHVDVGCLHVRPALNLRDALDEQKFRQISDAVYALVKKFGGVMWSEHGKGFRSAYGPEFHGSEVFQRMRQVKTAFDPRNQLNPGKICTPFASAVKLFDPFSHTRAQLDKRIAISAETDVPGALYCNGNGQCFDYRMDSVMCPSYKASADRVHSPKGRSGLMRDWLRQLSEKGYRFELAQSALSAQQIITRELRRFLPKHTQAANDFSHEDFSHQVKATMDGCLSCKACVTQCPIKVDVPTQKAQFLQHYHRRYPRPLRDYLLGSLEQWAPLAARLPGISNVALFNPVSQFIAEKFWGLTALPFFSEIPLDTHLLRNKQWRYDRAAMMAMSAQQRAMTVLVLQDPFTSFFDVPTFVDSLRLLEKLGFRVMVLPFIATGKALQVKGRLTAFEKTARTALTQLRAFVPEQMADEIAIVGIEPANTLLWRQEFAAFAGDQTLPSVLLLQEFLLSRKAQWQVQLNAKAAAQYAEPSATQSDTAFLFAHCTEKTQVSSATDAWAQVFAACGLNLQAVNTGCCGMAGSFGHEREHRDIAQTLYAQSWRESIAAANKAGAACATGYSCRCQAEKLDKVKLKHPVSLLLKSVSAST